MRVVLCIVVIAVVASGCVWSGSATDNVTADVGSDCSAGPGDPLDVAGEPDWRRYAGYIPWTDINGCLVRIDVLAERRGPAHCGWEKSQVIITGDPLGSRYEDAATDVEYVRDPNGVYGAMEFVDGFVVTDTLPRDATDTRYRQGERELWLSPSEPDAIFVYAAGSVERWPRGEVPKCR